MNSYVITKETVTVVVDGQSHSVSADSLSFKNVRKAVLEENWDLALRLMSKTQTLLAWLPEPFTFADGVISYEATPITPKLNRRLLAMAEKEDDAQPWLNFWAKLQKNPSFRSIDQLYDFMEHENIPIDAEGNLLAYKAVREDYLDYHSCTYDNTPGNTHRMPRNQVSDDPKLACHFGFHVGALKYASGFGGSDRRILICQVDPANVVCVPEDHYAMKVRVCEYKVLGHYASPLSDTVFSEKEEAASDEQDVDSDEDEIEEPVPPVKDISTKQLKAMTLAELRTYAAVQLKIVGASKIPGGKPALLKRILEVRRGK